MRYSCALILAALIYFFQTLLFWPEVSTESLVPRRTAVAGDLVLEILILMDFTTTPLARSHQIGFAADLAGNLTQDFADWHIYMGVVLFHDNVEYVLPLSDDLVDLEADLRQPTFGDSFVAIQNATNSTALRKTHRALSICNDELGLHYSAVLLFSNGTSSDLYRTHMEKRELEDNEVLIYSLALDNASNRSEERNTSLWDYTGRQYDVIGLDNATHHYTTDGIYLPELVHILASDLSSDIRDQASSTQSTTTSSTEEELEDRETSNSGLGGGAVVAIVLLTCCFTCSFVALAFYFWKGSRKSALVDPEPSPVVPTSSPPQPPLSTPPIPKDATQIALEEAINEQDLEKLHRCLSELLLQGWPDEKYADLVLKALDTVAKLRDFATASLQKSLAGGPFTGSLATAHLAGVDSKLVQKAQHERQGVLK